MSIHAESEESAQTKALRLEKENKHLQALLNTYKDSIKSTELTQVSILDPCHFPFFAAIFHFSIPPSGSKIWNGNPCPLRKANQRLGVRGRLSS